MGYFVAILIIALGFIKKNTKLVTYIQTAYMWALIALNYSSADYWAYEEMYRCCFEPRYLGHEPGYMALCKICLQLGWSYTCFRFIIAFLIVYFVLAGFRALTSNVNLAISLYLVFGFVGNVSGLRNAVAGAILIFASRYLLYDYYKSNEKYFICICIAMLFHYSACFYFLFLLCKTKIKPDMMGGIVLLVSVGSVFVLKSGFIYQLITSFTSREKTVRWFAGYDSLSFSPLYFISLILVFAFLFLLEYKERINCNNNYMNRCIIMRTEKIIIISLLSFALAICNSVVWLRILMAVLPVGFAVFSFERPVSYNQLMRFRQYNFVMISLGILSFLFVYVYWIGGNMWEVFENNYVFL